ncbi:MAG: phosphate acyltransferase PlsX [Vicinamibacteria bacterium]|nr:phosphate acyltransferase PlsX [Vicinamibacteria bacterium]
MSANGKVRVAVDAMGGDFGVTVAVEGAVAASRAMNVHVLLAGPRPRIEEALRATGDVDDAPIEIVEAPDVIGMDEKVSRTTLRKRSSIQVALELMRAGRADAFFSAGNTAACWTIAKMVLGTLDEVDRPALAAVLPKPLGRTVILDAGANARCKARHLEEFAIMGTVYVRRVFGVPEPRVGLMSMGEEANKGNDLTKEVHEALRGSALNFIGNVEGQDIFGDSVDVVVMDGFTGNVVLKASEGLALSMMRLLREELGRTPLTRLGALLSKRAFRAVRRRIDPAEHGGAPLLGVSGCCFIGHGKSTPLAVTQGIRAAKRFFESGVNEELRGALRTLALQRVSATVGIA